MQKQPDAQPNEKDFLIAYHIKTLREKNYPGIGGAPKCAADLKSSIQQYYAWENARRTPRKASLAKIEKLYGVTRDHFSQKPDDWKTIYAEMLEKWRKRVGQVNREVEDNKEMARSLPTVNQAMSSQAAVNAIFRLLVEKQAMAENGEIDPETFKEKMRSLQQYMEWSFANNENMG